MNDDGDLRSAVAALDWYHTIDLGGGIVTPGLFDLRPIVGEFGIPERLDGKSVLDVGPGNGFFSFLFEERGAASVATVELPSWSAHDASPVLQAFYASEPSASLDIHDALGLAARVRHSRVTRMFVNVYDFDPAVHGRYDIVFCSSVLLHLTDPLRALYRIFSATKEMALISTPIDDEASGGLREGRMDRAVRADQRERAPRLPRHARRHPRVPLGNDDLSRPDGLGGPSARVAWERRQPIAAGTQAARVEVEAAAVESCPVFLRDVRPAAAVSRFSQEHGVVVAVRMRIRIHVYLIDPRPFPGPAIRVDSPSAHCEPPAQPLAGARRLERAGRPRLVDPDRHRPRPGFLAP